jgi:hypothetical protein
MCTTSIISDVLKSLSFEKQQLWLVLVFRLLNEIMSVVDVISYSFERGGNMIMDTVQVMIWKKAVMAYFKIALLLLAW